MAAKAAKKEKPITYFAPNPKRTSIGLKHKPKGKHKRKSWKKYNRQG